MDNSVPVEIIDYEERYKQELEDISLPWLLEYDLLEPVDLEMLADPNRFIAGGGRVLLARRGETIMGMVMLELQGDDVCEALKFGVKETYREQGVGTALMEAVIQAARDAGQKTLVVTSNHKLKAALRIYEKLGFEYVTYSDKWFQLSDIRMELKL
nr:GNAT family N-acetyltransferase [uncultured Flavonifractor sp.]